MAGLRAAVILALLVTFLAAAAPADAQGAPDAPGLAVGTNKLFCHSSEDSLTVWMNTLQDDGAGVPYYITGEQAFVEPSGLVGAGVDPVAQEAVEVHIPLSPGLSTAAVVKGTVTAQAFIGSGAYGGGAASLGASLMAGTAVLGSAEPVDHTMQPHNGNVPGGTGPYEEITWTFDVPETPLPVGTPLEWVISGTIDVGNNVFLACHEARGYSNIDVPVTALEAPDAGAGSTASNTTTNSTTSVTTSSASSTSRSSSTSSASATTSAAANATSSGNLTTDSDESEDAPGLPVAGAGLALLVAAVALRRRLA